MHILADFAGPVSRNLPQSATVMLYEAKMHQY